MTALLLHDYLEDRTGVQAVEVQRLCAAVDHAGGGDRVGRRRGPQVQAADWLIGTLPLHIWAMP